MQAPKMKKKESLKTLEKRRRRKLLAEKESIWRLKS
jgi:hypothetical protein